MFIHFKMKINKHWIKNKRKSRKLFTLACSQCLFSHSHAIFILNVRWYRSRLSLFQCQCESSQFSVEQCKSSRVYWIRFMMIVSIELPSLRKPCYLRAHNNALHLSWAFHSFQSCWNRISSILTIPRFMKNAPAASKITKEESFSNILFQLNYRLRKVFKFVCWEIFRMPEKLSVTLLLRGVQPTNYCCLLKGCPVNATRLSLLCSIKRRKLNIPSIHLQV